MADQDPKPARGGLSLYANLLKLDSNGSPSTISSAPVVYKQTQGCEASQEQPIPDKSQLSSAAFRLQPTKRPQFSSQKLRPKATAQRPSNADPSTSVSSITKDEAVDHAATASRTQSKTLADWTADGDEGDYFAGEKRQRGGRKKRKKNKRQEVEILQNWDDIYDPARPNVFEDYKNSDERILEVQDWKQRLYAHRHLGQSMIDSDSESDSAKPIINHRFAPPPQFSTAFAPGMDDSLTRYSPPSPPPPPPPPPIHSPQPGLAHLGLTHDPTSHRSVRPDTSQLAASAFHQTLELDISPPPPPPPQPSDTAQDQKYVAEDLPPLPPPSSTQKPALKEVVSISRGPVRYDLPPPPPEIPASEADLAQALQNEGDASIAQSTTSTDARSARPGQKGFAERLMSKYGWTKGSGLGASGSGITAPLRVQIEKQKKKPDSEGGGYATPGGMGKIIGGKRKGGAASQESKFGPMSEVIVLRGMLDGMDIDHELGSHDGGLLQEIGEECGEKYGRVERVFIDRADPMAASVFVKFTAELSALRAVNALEGRVFNGNIITARFSDGSIFE